MPSIKIIRRTLDEAILEDERIERPHNKWKCEYMALRDIMPVCITCGNSPFYPKGKIYLDHCRVYPSFDIANTVGLRLEFPGGQKFLGPVKVE